MTQRTLANEFNLVKDWAHVRITDGETVGKKTWNGYVKTSNRWHRRVRDQQAENARKYKLSRADSIWAWSSRVHGFRYGEFLVTPLTNELALAVQGAHQQNCVGSFTTLAIRGNRRLFALQRGDEITGTVCIRRWNGTWQVDQALGYRNARLSRPEQALAKEIAKLYATLDHASATEPVPEMTLTPILEEGEVVDAKYPDGLCQACLRTQTECDKIANQSTRD